MSRLMKYALLGILSLALATAPLRPTAAQEIKPVAVVSVASIEKLLSDSSYLTEAAGVPGFAIAIALGTADYIVGLDKTKPGGAYVTIRMGEPQVVAFVPVSDLKSALENRKNEIGEPKDVGNGILEVASDRPNPIFIKEKNGWAFVSNSTDNLSNLPDNPVKLLGGLEKKYDLALRINAQNIPVQMKKIAVSFIRDKYEKTIKDELQDEDDPALRELKEKVGRRTIDTVVSVIQDSDQVTLGWGVDSMAKTTYLDFSMTAIQGTKLGGRMNLAGQANSAFKGFLLPDAAATFHLASKMPKQDAELLSLMFKVMKQAALKEMKEDKDLTGKKLVTAKEVVGALFNVMQSTVESGKLDGGAALVLKPKSFTFVAGGYVADGKALETAFKKVVDLAKSEPKFPGVKFDADQHRNVRFHTMKIPIPADEDEAKKIFGDSLDVVLGVGGKSIYFAIGKDGLDTLKKVIDKSVADDKQKLPTMQFNVALTPILKFASSIEDDANLAVLTAILEKDKGRDRVSITSRAIPNGTSTRLLLEEGVMRMIGEGATSFMGGGGF